MEFGVYVRCEVCVRRSPSLIGSTTRREVDAMARDQGWLVHRGRHLCPACGTAAICAARLLLAAQSADAA